MAGWEGGKDVYEASEVSKEPQVGQWPLWLQRALALAFLGLGVALGVRLFG
jgi:hypothetical protein